MVIPFISRTKKPGAPSGLCTGCFVFLKTSNGKQIILRFADVRVTESGKNRVISGTSIDGLRERRGQG
ncbi:hypothetical protein ACFO25_17320 [Paenactinomyces guangxiensis]|uniref:Uncharacterized protein n=1 Tax=Paenactinomyces guangxiensis TaxID=1490290 RepID=A0A7W1WRT2_9BACL|nr:hypothetical protein [Paenactinomyces guangxiensis]MBA4494774.1 hypothetical protein [Paenactinomyces guangxiensis]MBH8591858.1 hypothetical protein [Paenactinomyces guangxiensis]